MLPYLRYNLINWIDGMKLNREHFIAVDNNLLDRVRDAVAMQLTPYNYGILPAAAGSASSFNIAINIDRNQLLRVNIHELRAVTQSGVRIEISEQGRKEYAHTSINSEFDLKDFKSRSLYILLVVNPYNRAAAGEPDPTEQPPRYPYTDFEYQIHVVKGDDLLQPINGHYHLCIGKINVIGSSCEIDKDYVPPATSIRCLEELTDTYEHLDKVLSKLELDCTTIIQKIYKKEQTNALAKNVLYLCENVMQYLSASITHYRIHIKEQPPVEMIAYFMSLARLVKNTLDMKLGTGREELLTYFKDWIVEVNQGEFEGILDEIINLQYNHNDTYLALQSLEKFYVVVNIVFTKLAKLEYIGEKKSNNIIVTAEEAQVAPKKKKPSIFLD